MVNNSDLTLQHFVPQVVSEGNADLLNSLCTNAVFPNNPITLSKHSFFVWATSLSNPQESIFYDNTVMKSKYNFAIF